MSNAIRDLSEADALAVLALFQAAAVNGTLGRDPDEYALESVVRGLRDAVRDGLCLGAFEGSDLIGMVRGVRLDARRFRLVVSGVTAAVHPEHQGRGLGRVLFKALLARTDTMDPPVTRVELMLQAGNPGALRLYRLLGFAEEGVLRQRVRSLRGEAMDDIFMARLRPPLCNSR